ncbi:hypothetical protein ACF09L_32780 [Streptomyces sp. NPDC014779]|uniref:hypothetical protein n=1 Tax=Streptomyces sp. NPDC014779 TaxID=3364911 RepID=UPI0036F911FE
MTDERCSNTHAQYGQCVWEPGHPRDCLYEAQPHRGPKAPQQQPHMTDKPAFEYRNPATGDRLAAAQLDGDVWLKTTPKGCPVPPEHVEEVVAGIRDAARQATGQPAAVLSAENAAAAVAWAIASEKAAGQAATATLVTMATPCDVCDHTLNWHRNDAGCTVPACVCSRFREAVIGPAAGLTVPTNHNTETEARDRIENLWDRATPVGPLLDAYRAAILAQHRAEFTMADARGIASQHRANVLRDAAETVEAMNVGCSRARPCPACSTREDVAAELRRLAAGAES